MLEVRKSEYEQQQRLSKINKDLAALRENEKHIAQERLNLAREKQDLDKGRANLLCVSCRTPMKDGVNNAVSRKSHSLK